MIGTMTNRIDGQPGRPRIPGRVLGWMVIITAVAGIASGPRPGHSQETRSDLVVPASWLREHLRDPDVVVLQQLTRSYADEHIPGAQAIRTSDIAYSEGDESDPHQVVMELPDDLAPVRSALEAAGVSDDTHVVVTFSGRGITGATRLIWTLQVLGLPRVSLLDGGNVAWRDAGGELVTDVTAPRPGRIHAQPDLGLRIGRNEVSELSEGLIQAREPHGVALLDARETASYDGREEEAPGRAGHIPGAQSLPLSTILTDGTRLLDEDRLLSLFRSAGILPGDRVVVYCHIGLRATAVLFAARTLGFDAQLYDGSMAEWVRDPTLPLVSTM